MTSGAQLRDTTCTCSHKGILAVQRRAHRRTDSRQSGERARLPRLRVLAAVRSTALPVVSRKWRGGLRRAAELH